MLTVSPNNYPGETMAQCRVCKKCFTYNDDVGYDRELCGPIGDGVESGRASMERSMQPMKSSGIKLAAFCARLSGYDDVPPKVREEAIKLANEFRQAAGIQ